MRVVATFADPDGILVAAERARDAGFPVLDALTPFPLERLAGAVGAPLEPRLRGAMALVGFGGAVAFFLFESWTAVFAYPFNEGGRPLFSWPAFAISPFELGILVASIAGFAVFLRRAGLPGLNHALFLVPGVHRASQDRFLLVCDPLEPTRASDLRRLLFAAGATAISEADR